MNSLSFATQTMKFFVSNTILCKTSCQRKNCWKAFSSNSSTGQMKSVLTLTGQSTSHTRQIWYNSSVAWVQERELLCSKFSSKQISVWRTEPSWSLVAIWDPRYSHGMRFLWKILTTFSCSGVCQLCWLHQN